MPPTRRAGKSAFVQKFIKQNGEQGFTIHCRLCKANDDTWSSRIAAKRLLGKQQSHAFNLWADAMDLFAVHMKIHHADHPQPDWDLSDDVDVSVFDSEERFFVDREPTAEELMLRKLFGESRGREHEREVNRLRAAAERLGHRTWLPAEKIKGEASASQGWVCTCGASDPDTHNFDASKVKEASRQHLRDAVEASGS